VRLQNDTNLQWTTEDAKCMFQNKNFINSINYTVSVNYTNSHHAPCIQWMTWAQLHGSRGNIGSILNRRIVPPIHIIKIQLSYMLEASHQTQTNQPNTRISGNRQLCTSQKNTWWKFFALAVSQVQLIHLHQNC